MSAKWQWVVVQWFCGVSTLFCALILLLTWFNVAVLPESTFTNKRIGFLSVIGMVSFIVSAGSVTYLRISIGYEYEESTKHWILSIIYSCTWAIGQSLVYLLFTERLKYAFKGTKYQPSRRYFVPFYLLIGLFFTVSLVFHFISALRYFGVIGGDFQSDGHSGEVRDIVQQVIDLVLSIGLLVAFNHRLFVLLRDVTRYTQSSQPSSSSSMNMRQNAIIFIAARLTVISSFAIISTQMLMIYTTLIWEYCLYIGSCHESKTYYLWLKPICDAFWGIDCFINCLCIFLSYDFVSAQDAYYSLCWWFDRQCIKCCAKIADRSLRRIPNAGGKQLNHGNNNSLTEPILNDKETASALLAGSQLSRGMTVANSNDSTMNTTDFDPEIEFSSQMVSSHQKSVLDS